MTLRWRRFFPTPLSLSLRCCSFTLRIRRIVQEVRPCLDRSGSLFCIRRARTPIPPPSKPKRFRDVPQPIVCLSNLFFSSSAAFARLLPISELMLSEAQLSVPQRLGELWCDSKIIKVFNLFRITFRNWLPASELNVERALK